jgi:hypothetical protein
MGENSSGEREVVGCGLEAFGMASRCVDCKLGVEGGEVIENVHQLVLEVIPHHRSFGIVSKGGIPRELCSNIYGELSANPNKLTRVRLQLLNSARMRLSNVDGITTKCIDDLEVVPKHVRVLVIFGVDVLPYCRGERELGRLAKREVENVRRHGFVCKPQSQVLKSLCKVGGFKLGFAVARNDFI